MRNIMYAEMLRLQAKTWCEFKEENVYTSQHGTVTFADWLDCINWIDWVDWVDWKVSLTHLLTNEYNVLLTVNMDSKYAGASEKMW